MESALPVKNEKGFSEWERTFRETFLGNTADAQEK